MIDHFYVTPAAVDATLAQTEVCMENLYIQGARKRETERGREYLLHRCTLVYAVTVDGWVMAYR